jgi:Tol biopolymer transport system component
VPAANLPWLVLLVLAALVYLLVFRRIAPAQPLGARRLLWPAALVPPIVALLVVGLAHGETEHVTPIGSADGIAFAYAPEDASHIFVTRGGELVQITDSDGSELAPAWSPDHTRIAFQSNRDGNWEVYVANADGTDVERLTHDDADDGEPDWSPDGKRIAFIRDGALTVMRDDGSRARKIASGADWPSWSAKAEFLAYETRSGQTHGVVAFGRRGQLASPDEEDLRYPAWSPKGQMLAYECLRMDQWHICITDLRSGSEKVLAAEDSNAFAPAWSPDGKRIAFISDRDGPDQLFVMRADGTHVVRLTNSQGDKDTPAWR